MQVTYPTYIPFWYFFWVSESKNNTALLKQLYPTLPMLFFGQNAWLNPWDFGWASHGSREWSRPGKAGCNDGDAGTGDRLSWGDEGDQGGWMVRHGHLNEVWYGLDVSCFLFFFFLDYIISKTTSVFCFRVNVSCWSWFLGCRGDVVWRTKTYTDVSGGVLYWTGILVSVCH